MKEFITDQKCRICGSETIIIEKVADIATNVSALFHETTIPQKRDAVLYKCPVCTHFQISDVNIHNMYSNYLMTSTMSDLLIEERKKSLKYLSSLAKGHNQVLDIGCGPGVIFKLVEQYFENIVGVEPSKSAYDIAVKTVINGFFGGGGGGGDEYSN
jgi:SAM-dependent methyltransferase